MCDAWVAMEDVTRNGSVLFAKNSDRPAGECQVLHYAAQRRPAARRTVKCSYVQVDDSKGALATIGCQPYWCWGYETGLNEAGVVGGNTAIFTKSLGLEDKSQEPGLTGMDLLRFGLERGATAERAVEEIIELLERYGQAGSAVQGQDHVSGAYENAFLVADGKESWILETSGRRWVAKQATKGYQALSNQPTIRDRWTNTCPDIQDFADEMGWWHPSKAPFDFARVYGDHEHYSRQVSHIRWKRVSELLEGMRGNIDRIWAMRILRDHLEDTFLEGPQFHPLLPDFHTICMHDAPSGFTWGNTATSFIVELDPSGDAPPLMWLAYQPPCTSIYIGFSWTDALPELLTRPGKAGPGVRAPKDAPSDRFDKSSLWWRLYRILQAVKESPDTRYLETVNLFREIETENIDLAAKLPSRAAQLDWGEVLETQLERIVGAIESLERKWNIV